MKNNICKMAFFVLATCFLSCVLPAFGADGGSVVFYLNPSATVEGDGTRQAPFMTFEAAQRAVRKAVADTNLPDGPVIVKVAKGRHFIKDVIRFHKEDSGTAKRPVIWRSAKTGMARLTGGRDILNWVKPDAETLAKLSPEAAKHVRAADLKEYVSDVNPDRVMIVWGDSFLTYARWPNDEYTKIRDVEMVKDANGNPGKPNRFTYADTHVDTWVDETDARAVGFFKHDWAAAKIEVAKIDPEAHVLEQKGECRHYGYSKSGYWYGSNILRELDRPGEYHVSSKTGKVHVWPLEGAFDLAPQVTVTKTLVECRDTTHLSFVGFVFESTYSEAVSLNNAEGMSFVACRFLNVGTAMTVRCARSLRIAGCDAHHCNSGAFKFYSCGDADKLERAEVEVTNCHISDYARESLTYSAGIQAAGCCGVDINRCLIHEGPHVAILFSGRLIRIANNEIHSVCLDAGEMGAVYAGRDWTLCGNEITGNWFHDIGVSKNGWNPNRAIMLDDGAAGITMTSNIIERVVEGISLSSVGNRIERNLFVNVFPPISGWQQWSDPADYKHKHLTHKSLLDKFYALPVTEEPWKSRFPYLALMRKSVDTETVRDLATNSTIAENVYVGNDGLFYVWRTYKDSLRYWNVRDNIRSKDGHEAKKFIPAHSKIGVYENSERAVWPVDNGPVHKYTATEMMESQRKRYRNSDPQ